MLAVIFEFWPRDGQTAWKVGRILDQNPEWSDLYHTLA